MLRSPSSRSALSASKGLKGLLLDVRTNAEHLWASTKKTGSSPELLAEPLFAQQEVRTTGRCECNWYFSVPVTPHEFSRVASDIGVLATGHAAGIDSSNSDMTHDRQGAGRNATRERRRLGYGTYDNVADLAVGFMTMSLRNDAGGRVALMRSARARYVRL